MKTLALLTTMLFIPGMTHAQGLMGTSKSFLASPFCKEYKCSLIEKIKDEKGIYYSYRTSLGYKIGVFRVGNSANGIIYNVLLTLKPATPILYSTDTNIFKEMQIAMFGQEHGSFIYDCYSANTPRGFINFNYKNKNYVITCGVATLGGVETMFISTPTY